LRVQRYNLFSFLQYFLFKNFSSFLYSTENQFIIL